MQKKLKKKHINLTFQSNQIICSECKIIPTVYSLTRTIQRVLRGERGDAKENSFTVPIGTSNRAVSVDRRIARRSESLARSRRSLTSSRSPLARGRRSRSPSPVASVLVVVGREHRAFLCTLGFL